MAEKICYVQGESHTSHVKTEWRAIRVWCRVRANAVESF